MFDCYNALIMDFSNYTLEQMDELTDEEIKEFTTEEFWSYFYRNEELGRSFIVGGLSSFIGHGEPIYMYGPKTFEKVDGQWTVGINALGPPFDEWPRLVDEETFRKKMLSLGVDKDMLDEFINVEYDWDDF